MIRLVFVHGFLGSAINWLPVLTRLKMPLGVLGVDCTAVNLLWHAKRPGPLSPKDIGLKTMADDLKVQLAKKEGERIFAVAHSFGIRPLLQILQDDRYYFDGIIVEDSSPELSQRGFELLGRIFKEIPVPFENRESARSFLNLTFGTDSQMSRFLLSNLGPVGDSEKQDWRFQATALHKILDQSFGLPMWEEWESFPKPGHLIVGANSHFVSKERIEKCLRLGNKYGRSLDLVEDAGHWVHADQPEQFCDLVQKKIEAWI